MVFIISETLIIFLLVYIIAKLKVEIEDLQGKNNWIKNADCV